MIAEEKSWKTKAADGRILLTAFIAVMPQPTCAKEAIIAQKRRIGRQSPFPPPVKGRYVILPNNPAPTINQRKFQLSGTLCFFRTMNKNKQPFNPDNEANKTPTKLFNCSVCDENRV